MTNVNNNQQTRLFNWGRQDSSNNRTQNANASTITHTNAYTKADNLDISLKSREYAALLPINMAEILGVSEEELVQMVAERNERFANLSPLNLPESQMRVVRYSIDMTRIMTRGTTTTPYSLEEQMKGLANAFEAVREEVSGNSNRHMNFLQDAFRMAARGMFVTDAEVQFSSSTTLTRDIETPEGRLLNQEYLELVQQVHEEATQRANLFSEVFFNHFREHGVGAFEFAWAAVNGQTYGD